MRGEGGERVRSANVSELLDVSYRFVHCKTRDLTELLTNLCHRWVRNIPYDNYGSESVRSYYVNLKTTTDKFAYAHIHTHIDDGRHMNHCDVKTQRPLIS